MKGGLFWKLLLAFWVAFFVITQLVWVLVIVEPPITAQDDSWPSVRRPSSWTLWDRP